RNYRDIEPYIERVRRGRTEALLGSGQRVLMFALTSGTTAKPKYIPVTEQTLAQWRQGWNVWGLKAILDHEGTLLRDIVQVTSPMHDHLSPSGIPCGAITGLLAETQKRLVRRYYVAPLEVSEIRDSAAKYYTIMRLAITRDVAFMVTANPATLLRLARAADENREQIIRDVRNGSLWPDIPVSSAIRRALEPRMRPRPERARQLEQCIDKHGGLYPAHYWRLGFRAHWTGGTMGLYESQLPTYFGQAPVRDIGLLASEGRMSIPLEDGTASGVLAVAGQFFEFIPAEEYGASNPTLLRSHEVSVGHQYFLIITNSSGLYRYDLGDRVRVTGRLGEAPLIQFLSRDAHTSSLTGDKLTEDQVVLAMGRIARSECENVSSFVLAPRWDDPPRYRLYAEPADGELAERLDTALREINLEYESKRVSRRLGPIELTVLPMGALAERDRRLRAAKSRTVEQYKHQYLLTKPGSDDELAGVAERP
ncbi:MAG: GH3 auxin-responsive promoter family protein, partial [Planctomycetota bacterium]|nr:GH3 auxin-responsive promoter family protein [Planctomycetota bacterium]